MQIKKIKQEAVALTRNIVTDLHVYPQLTENDTTATLQNSLVAVAQYWLLEFIIPTRLL